MVALPECSEQIATLGDAQAYYRAKLVGAHKITCHGRAVTIIFEAHATHLFSVEADDAAALPEQDRVPNGRGGVRRFSVDRARLMDRVLPAVSSYTVSVPGTGPRGREKRMLHGARLSSGMYLRVVLRPGPGDAFTCASAYPVTEAVWRAMMAAKRARFPP
ncbi:MAG: hypothetical protein HY744_01530 [Deltaproteobacteria bacterium]|nr:hypothetical protein [Deltaproteobacteria bacterium]